MFTYDEIRVVHVELTEKCNLSCLMCDRNVNGEYTNPYLKNRELTFDALKKAFPISFCKQLNGIYFCGNYGEPALSNSLIPFLKYLKNTNATINTSLVTNGCVRSEKWWKDLSKVTNSVRFGIDGLQDTHKIYRQGADWSLVIRNAKAYIDAGGYAIWDYLVFGHNEHQIDIARKLSQDLGFKEFVVKKTGRFFKYKDRHLNVNKPKNKNNINKSLLRQNDIINEYGSIESYLNKSKIDCKAIKKNEIYLSAEGLLLPCCWVAGQLYKWYLKPKSAQIWDYIDLDSINVNNNSIENIILSGAFNDIEDSWFKNSIEEGKLKVCALKCGHKLDQFSDQYK